MGATGTWTLTYKAGMYGIDDRGGIIVVQRPMADGLPLQAEAPGEPGYVTARTSGPARVRVSFRKRYWIRPCKDAIVVEVFDGSLAPGDGIVITIGDTSRGGPGCVLQTFPETAHAFHVLVDAFGTREYYPLAESPAIRIVPGPAARLDAVLPSVARPGEPVPLRIRVSDAWHNPLDEFEGTVEVTTRGATHTYDIRSGVQKVDDLVFDQCGSHCVTLRCGSLEGESNPVFVTPEGPPLFWADMHGQTEGTVGTGSVEEYFRFARDKGLIDITSWQGNDFQVTDVLWADVCRQTARFYAPSRFVTYPGYEWSGLTPAGGDHNILFIGDGQTLHRSSHWQIHDGSTDSTDRYPLSALWREFQGRKDVMAIAHVGGRYANLDFWNPDFSGLIEVHSHHGTFEWILHEALERRLVFGVVGQSDDHSGRPGLSAPLRALPRDFATFDVFGGLTGVYAPALDRESVWEALRARHCYATSGARILLQVRSGDAMMGDLVPAAGPVPLEVTVLGTAALLDVDVYRDGEAIHRQRLTDSRPGTWVRIEWSGVRVRSRSKIADWPVTVTAHGARIEAHRPYGFRQPDETVAAVSEDRLEIASRTSGDVRGVFVKLSSEEGAVHVESPHATETVTLRDLDDVPRRVPAGGVNMGIRFSRVSPESRERETTFRIQADPPAQQRSAYWVRVLQMDGHMAWSSPVFVERERTV